MRFLVALILSFLAANVARAGIVVWMDEEVPDEKVTTKADNKTGGTKHLAYFDMAFPPQPAGPADDEKWEALRQAVSDGKKRWDEFEVEFEIATDLEVLISELDVIRTNRDLDELVAAMLFQGAAVQVAFEADEFENGKRAKPFRYARTGGVGNRPWADAYALQPERAPLGSDVADGATYPDLLSEFEAFGARAHGTLKLAKVDSDAQVFVDGVEVELAEGDEGTALDVAAGRHWIHLVRDGVVSGRQVVLVEEGREGMQMPRVTMEDVAAARARIDSDTTTGFPESVKSSLESLSRHYGGQIFVGSNVEGRTVVLPYAHGAELLKQRVVSVVGVGEIGGGLMSTSLFDGADGNQAIAPMGMGSLGFELGVYNFALLAGTDIAMTPGNTITHAKGDSTTENVDTSVFVQPYAGAGVYLLRPTGRSTTALISGHYSWLHPAHHAVGGRITLGVPFEPEGGTWVRLTIGGSGFPKSMWDEGSDRTSIVLLYARSGIAARF